MSAFETLIYEKEGGLAYVTLNRPRVLNVYNIQMRDELYQILEALRDDPEVGVAIFKGEGRAFCAGADLSEFLTAPSPLIARRVRWERDVWGLFIHLPQVLIAALHGYVLGSGIEIALCCDLRIASPETRFGLPEVGLGIIPAAGGTQTLPRALPGWGKALEMLLRGDLVDTSQALQMGLVNQVVPREELLPRAEEMAHRVLSLPPEIAGRIKQALHRGMDMPLPQSLDLERRLWPGLRS